MASHVTLFYDAAPANSPNPVQIPGTGDVKVLNYALALETLEAELYRQALARLTIGGTDDLGGAITGLDVSGSDVDYITEFSKVENEHRDFLTSALKGNWVTNSGAKFDFGINSLDRKGVVQLVYGAELTGVAAYLGGAKLLAIGSPYLQIAAAILGTEARHTTAVAIVLNGPTFNESPKVETAPLANENGGKDSALTPDQVLNQTATIAFPGGTVPPGGTIPPKSGPNGLVVLP